MLIELQTQQLSDNIRKYMDLLEDNENELRYESDPCHLASTEGRLNGSASR